MNLRRSSSSSRKIPTSQNSRCRYNFARFFSEGAPRPTIHGKNLSAPVIALDDVARRARRRTGSRILSSVCLLYGIACLYPNNLSTSALQMPHDLGFDDRVIGFGAGIFALGYVILEIPGTLIVERWSARRWFTRIMISWGLVTIGMAFVRTPHQFYTMRFLLGLAEA